MLGKHGICIKNIGLESPEQLGRTDRHGGMWKATAKRAIQSMKIVGTADMTILALANNSVMNDGTRKGGFSPSQWVLGQFPRNPGSVHDEAEFADLDDRLTWIQLSSVSLRYDWRAKEASLQKTVR